MTEDLDPIIRNWPFAPGSLQVRTIQGKDERLKLQLRLDLGILQMEIDGRPDGQMPFNCDSLLDYYEKLAARFQQEGRGNIFKLNMEDCLQLQQESIQYYHRYLAFFQLQNFEGVIRDTERNLRLFNFVVQYAERPELAVMFQPFRSYVLLTLTRARGMIALQKKDYTLAMKYIEWGIQEIRDFFYVNNIPESIEKSSELHFLQNWREEIQKQRPLSLRERLQKQIHHAIQKEDYERAARLRDALKELT